MRLRLSRVNTAGNCAAKTRAALRDGAGPLGHFIEDVQNMAEGHDTEASDSQAVKAEDIACSKCDNILRPSQKTPTVARYLHCPGNIPSTFFSLSRGTHRIS